MLSDIEIFHLQRSIAFHRNKQADEINGRDSTISSLQAEIRSLNSVIAKHQDQFMAVKEKLVTALTEFEMRGKILDNERKKSAVVEAALESAENALQLARQEKDFVRRQLAEAEGLIALSSQHRSRAQEQETALLHSREQQRILTDMKTALDSQLAVSVRELEANKFRAASLEMKTEAVINEKGSLTEVIFELKQQLAKIQISNAEEVSEGRRELLRARDLVESERLLRIKSQSDSEMQRIKELEDRRQIAEEKYRQSQLPSINEREVKMTNELERLGQELMRKEKERVLEAEKVIMLDLQLAKMQIQLDANVKHALEMDERYDAMRAEGRYARQQVLDAVGFVMDIITITGPDDGLQNEQPQQGQQLKAHGYPVESKRPGPVLLLSPRAKAAIKDTSLVHLSDSRTLTKRPTPDESGKNVVECDPFDLAILHGLTDALCLPDLRSVLQALRDHMERVMTVTQLSEDKSLTIDPIKKINMQNLKLDLEASENTIKFLESDVYGLRANEGGFTRIIAQLESEIKGYQILGKKRERDRENAVLETESKMKIQQEIERASLHAQVDSLKEQVAALASETYHRKGSIISPVESSASAQEILNNTVDQSGSAVVAFANERAHTAMPKEELYADLVSSNFPLDYNLTRDPETLPQTTDMLHAIRETTGANGQLDDASNTINHPLFQRSIVTDNVELECLATKEQLRSAEVKVSASLLAAVREKDFDELSDIRMKLKWAKNHHNVMRRVVLQLERELKTQCDENNAIKMLQAATAKELQQQHADVRNSRDTIASQSTRSVVQLNSSSESEGSGVPNQVVEKLRTHAAMQDRIVTIYRESLFALIEGSTSKVPYCSSSGVSNKVAFEFHEEDGTTREADRAIHSFPEYDHDRDYSIRSLYLDEDSSRRHANDAHSTNSTHDGILTGSWRDITGEGGQIQGPGLCQWLDGEIAALKKNYEEEIMALEEIIITLRGLAEVTGSKKKKKKRSKPSHKENPIRLSRSDDFVVRHVDRIQT